MNKFVHLHVHSEYSLLDGLSKIDALIAKAKADGMEAIALTDHGAMYGAIEFYKKCLEAGIKPIIGAEIYIAPRRMTDRAPKIDTNPYHLTLLAKDEAGYKNLMKIISISHLEGYYYKPRIDRATLKKYTKGLICLSGCLAGEIPRLVLAKKKKAAEKRINFYKKIFGQDNFFLEIQPHQNLLEQKKANRLMIKLGRKTKTQLVITKDAHYLDKGDKEAHEIQLCIQTGKTILDQKRMSMAEDDFDFSTIKEMEESAHGLPSSALLNSGRIAKRCNLKIKLGEPKFPRFKVPNGHTPASYLKKLSYLGYAWRYLSTERDAADAMDPEKIAQKMDKEKKVRLDYELSIIEECRFSSYFLIVADFVRFAQDKGILVGPGRGSAAGSFTAYLLGITGIDPLHHDLLFERFLNPERVTLPDFDIDFADTRRSEVIEYVTQKYGQDHVAQIITFGRMESRAAIRDTARAMGLSYNDGDRVAKLIPFGAKLKDALNESDELKALYNGEASVRKLYDMAEKLEGVARHASLHAAGVVISYDKLTEYAPLQRASKGDISITTQYSMYYVESVGLIKMDFLGLSNLSILQNALRIIKRVNGKEIDLNSIPIDDQKTYELLSAAETTGVFQLSSDGMKRYLRELKPSTFEDITAMVALYRPGPIESIPDFIAAKHGRRKVIYLDPRLEPILKNTYGVIVNQEQVLQIARELAGFTYGEADILRRAVGKKIKELLAEQKEKLLEGMINNKVTKETAHKIWAFIEPFAAYGFNKSHAAGYAMIAYQTAYLKAHYPSAFMAALLTADQDDLDKVARDISECEHLGIKVLPPDVNESYPEFAVVPKTGDIRFALAAIKNVGLKASEDIVKERKKNGPYLSLENFIKRLSLVVNKKLLESLARAGALDYFGERRAILVSIPEILKYASSERKSFNASQIGLFGQSKAGEFKIELSKVEPAAKEERLLWEKELLGIYISEHPLKDFQSALNSLPHKNKNLYNYSEDKIVEIGGIISTIKKIITKTGEPMLFVGIEDLTSRIELLVFPSILKNDPILWQEGSVIHVSGRLSFKDGRGNFSEPKVIVNQAKKLELKPALFNPSSGEKPVLHLRIRDKDRGNLGEIKESLLLFKGESEVVLHLSDGGGFKPVRITAKVKLSDELLLKLRELLGEDSVKVRDKKMVLSHS